MRRNKHQHNFNDFSDQEREKLKTVRQELTQAQKKEPERLWEHLQAFNDGVMAIIITIIVLEIQPAIHEVHYEQFIANIIVFLITFFVVADFWYDLHLAFSYYILEYLIQYFGAKKTAKYSQIMNIIISRSFIRKVTVTLFLNVILIVLSLFIPKIAMILYLVIPVTSFLFPVKRNKIV